VLARPQQKVHDNFFQLKTQLCKLCSKKHFTRQKNYSVFNNLQADHTHMQQAQLSFERKRAEKSSRVSANKGKILFYLLIIFGLDS
jgi:hypothetical protein